MTQAVLIERDGPVAILTLNRPQTRNALSDDVIRELEAFLAAANEDDSLGCILLTGAGEAFSSGGNVKEMRDGSHPMFAGTPAEMQEAYRRNIQVLPRLFGQLDVPAIAAVNGLAIGAGMDIATMCDIRLASTEASFAESFLRVGLISGDGGAWYLPRVVGYPRAVELALTCRTLNAAEALDWGLVTHVLPPEELMPAAREMAHRIASFAPRSVRLNKRLIRQSMGLPLETALDLAASYQAIIQHTPDHREALLALLERRKPVFQD
ncbi:enoyl-CoA hydratase-related protein [Haematobacter genomosp. 1]|uniref:Enoyl-CoA hydratase n=1 Tax=Haematobacter genomosp. 1 TaxID=366618 RepID=A0A212AE94_9RHOB|nr:enoyl-CoA hydratase-related protein [Haematobacter genomosp. 1]OWJ79629.1 enoyl-CoA hydratase [Haematobacter genomosp. 1]